MHSEQQGRSHPHSAAAAILRQKFSLYILGRLRGHELPQRAHLSYPSLQGLSLQGKNMESNTVTKTKSQFGLLFIFWFFNLALLILRLCYLCSLQTQSILHIFNTWGTEICSTPTTTPHTLQTPFEEVTHSQSIDLYSTRKQPTVNLCIPAMCISAWLRIKNIFRSLF